MNQHIVECTTPESWRQAFEVMKELRPDHTLETFMGAVDWMQSHQGYRLAAVVEGERMVAVAGYRFGRSLAWGSFLYIDDLVTSPAARSGGHGQQLLAWLEDRAREQGCAAVHLDSGVQRHGAHRFYLRERYDIVFYHFKKSL